MSLLYKSIAFADSPFVLTSAGLDDLNNNQNSLILDVDTSGGNVEIQLPSITSLLFGGSNGNANCGAGAFTFYMNVNISVAGNGVTFTPFSGVGDQDFICGSSTGERAPAPPQGGCFKLFIAGRHQWGLFFCGVLQPTPPPEPPQ